jgi:hypothetical protein
MPSITSKFLNQMKRETEALAVTVPALLNEGGGRTNAAPEYVQGGVAYTAAVAPKEAITGKTYLLVEEAFPATTTVTITIGGTAVFTDAPVSSTGLTVSTVEDMLLLAGSDVSVTVSGTGDVTTGKLQVITNYTPYTVKNGRYTDVPAV